MPFDPISYSLAKLARLKALAHASRHATGGADPITSLDAGVITSGSLSLDRLPAIPCSKLDAVDTPAPGEVPSYNATAGKFEWIPVGGGGGGLRSATKIVAASNSLDKTRADYVCDGVDDQAEINDAISALGTTGGMVLLLEGTYNITGSINLASNVAIVGQGPGTVLRIPNGFNADLLGVIAGSGVSRVLVADLRIDGNKENQIAGGQVGIYLTSTTHSKIASCWVENMSYPAVWLDSSGNNTVMGNTFIGNLVDIYLDSSSGNTITGNICRENIVGGIFLEGSSYNTIANNICHQGGGGIYISASYNSGSNNNIVAHNTCRNNGGEGIFIGGSSHNIVTGNFVLGNSQEQDNLYDGIVVNGEADYNLISGNLVRHMGLTNQQRYGINIAASTCDGNLVHGNDLYQAGKTGDFNDDGTGTIYHNNRTTAGWVT